jgi:hypothetical protein
MTGTRRTWPVLLSGAMLGCIASLILISQENAGWAQPILRPFGMLGFILGNVHQGSAAISITALLLAGILTGTAIGVLVALVLNKIRGYP